MWVSGREEREGGRETEGGRERERERERESISMLINFICQVRCLQVTPFVL